MLWLTPERSQLLLGSGRTSSSLVEASGEILWIAHSGRDRVRCVQQVPTYNRLEASFESNACVDSFCVAGGIVDQGQA